MVLHNHRKGRARYIGSDDFIYIICKYLYTTNPSHDFPTAIRNITSPPSPQNSQRDITSLHFVASLFLTRARERGRVTGGVGTRTFLTFITKSQNTLGNGLTI